MKRSSKQRLSDRWRRLSPGRRLLIQVLAWVGAGLVCGQLLWLPLQQRLQAGERQLQQAHELALHLQRVATRPSRLSAPGAVLTLARLSARAEAAGLQITGLETRARRVQMDVEGEPVALLQWLHELERDGARLHELQLQGGEELLQGRLALELDDA